MLAEAVVGQVMSCLILRMCVLLRMRFEFCVRRLASDIFRYKYLCARRSRSIAVFIHYSRQVAGLAWESPIL